MDAEGERKPGTHTDYALVHNGQSYPPKSVISLACRGLIGRVLEPDEFSGGEAPGQTCFVLRELGFTVEKSGQKEPVSSGQDWSANEVALIVADYFLMLKAELSGEPYSKAQHNRELRPLLNGRSKSSVEFKHQNISAVLVWK